MLRIVTPNLAVCLLLQVFFLGFDKKGTVQRHDAGLILLDGLKANIVRQAECTVFSHE